MRSHEFVSEIERISTSDYQGGKGELGILGKASKFHPLPGGAGFVYSIEGQEDPVIKIYDTNRPEAKTTPRPEKQPRELWTEYYDRLERWEQQQQKMRQQTPRTGQRTAPTLIGKLALYSERGVPIPGAVRVATITVDEDYRGRGIAKALYGIVLTIMRRTLVAGDNQTPGGRRNWVSLASIPGVDVRGWVSLSEEDFRSDSEIHDRRLVKQVEQNIDTVMGKLGGQYIGRYGGEEYFAFDVQPNSSGRELEARVKTNLSRVYNEDYSIRTGLYAQWTGS